MLRFTLFGIPTKVQWMFWVVMALLGGIGRSGMNPEGMKLVAIFVGAGFLSILVHELGHALTARKYGARPEILLYGFGGLASYPDVGRITRNQRLHIIAAGPGFGLVLGAISWLLLYKLLPVSSIGIYLFYLLNFLVWINIVWSLLNMLPIYPLDGGQFLGTWMNGNKMVLRSQIGTGVAAAVAVYAIMNKQIFMAVMFGMLAYQNYQMGLGKRVKFF